MNKTKTISSVLNSFGLLDFALCGLTNNLTVLNFHRIKENKYSTSNFSDDVFGLTLSEFEIIISWASKKFNILTEEEFIELLYSKKNTCKKNKLLITFDDAYVDNYTLAFPVLNNYNATAIFFIPYSIVEKRKLGWWDIISYFLKNTRHENIKIYDHMLNISADLENSIKYIYSKFKTVHNFDRKKELMYLSDITDVDYPCYEMQSKEIMTWDQIVDLKNKNMSIGSHTVNHDVLSTLSYDQQLNEMLLSKKLLEEKLNCTIKSIAYPVGGKNHFSLESQEIAKYVGYSAGFSFFSGVNLIGNIDPFCVKRFAPYQCLSSFKYQILYNYAQSFFENRKLVTKKA